MRKPNLLEEDGKERGNKWVVYCVIIVGVLIGAGIFVGGIYTSGIDNYISQKPISKLYDFYDVEVGQNETAIYFMGNSQIGADVYVPLINENLNKQGYTNLSIYNIYRDSDNPLRRLSQIEDIISSRPSLIIYGVSPWIFTRNSSGWVDEDVILVHDRLNINSSSLSLYSTDELADISQRPDAFYLKRFFKSSLLNAIQGNTEEVNPVTYAQNIFDPWTSDDKRVRYSNTFDFNGENLSKFVEITENYANTSRNKISLAPFTGEKTRKLLAFEYMLNRFADEKITVVLVVMPEHSILNNLTPKISEINLHKYLSSTNLSWYDLDDEYGDEIMADLTHVHWDGAMELAPRWADIIIQEVNRNAVHNS